MKIEKYVKDKNNKYKVYIDNEVYMLYDDIIAKYQLLFKNDIEKEELDNIIKDNMELSSYYQAIKYITKKLRSEKEIDDYAVANECEIIGQFITITKLFSVYKTVHNGVELAICQAPLGGAAATQIMEQLIAGGVKKVVAAGCCG